MEDNLYRLSLTPEEFHELLTEYESFVEQVALSLPREHQELPKRVLEKLRQADAMHVCVDEEDHATETENTA